MPHKTFHFPIFIIFTSFLVHFYTKTHTNPWQEKLAREKEFGYLRKSGQEMYSVPMEIPQFCNKCPFGACNYSFPHSGSSISMIDRKENRTGTYGYLCNLDFYKNGRYTKILRADVRKDIKKPAWCGLKEII